MIFRWLRRAKPDPQLEALKEKIAAGEQTIAATEDVLKEAMKRAAHADARLENRKTAVKHKIEEGKFLSDLGEGWGDRDGS